MASTSGSSGLGFRRQRKVVGKRRRVQEEGASMEITPTVRLPVGETHAATRQDLRRAISRVARKQELKHIDVGADNLTLTTNTPSLVFISPIAAAATSTGRIGDEVSITSVQGKFEVHCAAGNSGTINAPLGYRLMVVCDQEVAAALPAASNILDVSVVTNYLNAPYNSDFCGRGKRFKILYDERGRVPVSTTYTGPISIYDSTVSQFKRSFRRKQVWDATGTGTIAHCLNNSLVFIAISDTTNCLVNYGTRVIFKDD